MNIVKMEIRTYLKSSLWYLGGMLLMTLTYFAFYPSFAKDAVDFLKVMESFPVEIQRTLGLEMMRTMSLLGYYACVLLYTLLIGAVMAMNLGISILSKEERDKTADFLFTRPASRIRIISAKLLASLALILGLNLIFIPMSYLIVAAITNAPYDGQAFLLLNLTLPLIQLIFLSLGFFIGVFLRRIKTTISITLAVVFGFFALGSFAVQGKDDGMRFLSPFKYFDSSLIIKEGRYEPAYLLAGLLVIVLATVTSYYIYVHKDIDSV